MQIDVEFPRKFQDLFTPNRYKIYQGGRGGAKSWNFARALLILAVQKPLRILCTREFQSSIRESVHRLLSDQIELMGLQSHYEIVQNEIRGKNGSLFIFEGLRHNTDKIKSMEGIDICWVEEADKVQESSWALLIPTIRKPKSEFWISFNPGLKTDATYQRFVLHPPEGALCVKVGWRDNPWFPDELKQEMEHLKSVDYDEYLHVWEGELKNFADGAIYGKQLKEARKEGRICSIPIEKSIPVNTFWDLGRNDSTAIWFHQHIGKENRFIDYYECRLEDLDHYIRKLKEKDYLYGTHYLPHDVAVTDLSAKTSRKEILELGGVKPIEVVPRIPDISEGIGQTRQVFPTCWFDEKRCEDGLDSLANYQYTWDETYNTFRQRPLHNWASNGADAFRQFAQGFQVKDTSWDKPLTYPKRHRA